MRKFADAISEHFVRSSGPGGQNVNKVSTSVELRFDLAKSGLSDVVQARLRRLAGSRLIGDRTILIEAHQHRTQAKNRAAARERLLALIDRASRLPKTRRATRPSRVAREQRIVTKHRRAVVKQRRGKVEPEE